MKGLFLKGSYLRRETCVSKLIGPALQLEVNLSFFALFYLVFEGNFPNTSPRVAYIWRGDLMKGFLRYRFGVSYLEGLIQGGAYFRNFTVFHWLELIKADFTKNV